MVLELSGAADLKLLFCCSVTSSRLQHDNFNNCSFLQTTVCNTTTSTIVVSFKPNALISLLPESSCFQRG